MERRLPDKLIGDATRRPGPLADESPPRERDEDEPL
jgi:hypothetical protein